MLGIADLSTSTIKVRTLEEFICAWQQTGPLGLALERTLTQVHHHADEWPLVGYCEACQEVRAFQVRTAPHTETNWRETMHCEVCHLNNRLRHIAGYLRQTVTLGSQLYLYEQVTPFYRWARTTYGEPNVTGSEYLGDHIESGTMREGIRHEDGRHLSFVDASFDVLVSCEVFEHVPDIHAVLGEANRVLRPGGELVMTIPFMSGADKTVQRARLSEEGTLEHLLPPTYHGNPIDPEKGSLVFYDYGWDFLQICTDAGFRDAYMLPYYSLWYGYLGEGLQNMFLAVK